MLIAKKLLASFENTFSDLEEEVNEKEATPLRYYFAHTFAKRLNYFNMIDVTIAIHPISLRL